MNLKVFNLFISSIFLSLNLFALNNFSNQINVDSCVLNDDLKNRARDFMESNNLILPGEEFHWKAINSGIKWQLIKTVTYQENCLLVMRLADYPNTKETGSLEVLGFKDNKILNFEELFHLNPMNEQIVAEFRFYTDGDLKDGENNNFTNHPGYFALLKGQDAISVRKAFYTGHTGRQSVNDGFIGKVRKFARASWDPQNRVWGVVEASYKLRNSDIGEETSSIYSFQLDLEDFDVYYNGGVRVLLEDGKEALNVRPWSQTLHQIFEVLK